MRKCPNCKKPVPVGARRCVYCRILIGEASEVDSTRLGVGGQEYADSDEEARNNTTSFGHPGGGGGGGRPSFDLGERDSRQFDEAPHQTMLGLGPIAGGSSRTGMGGGRSSDSGEGGAQRTIAGMPGLSFDAPPPKTVSRGSAEALQPIGGSMSAGISQGRSPVPSGNMRSGSFGRGILASSVRSSQNFEPISAADMPSANSPQHAYASSVGNPAVSRSSSPSIAEPAPSAGIPANPTVPEPAEDILANMPGVVPSSLVDEEFVDLTSKLFGDDFAAVNDPMDDEDDDGLDFDLPGANPAPAPAPAVADPAPAPATPAPAPAAEAAAAQPEPAAAAQPETDAAAPEPETPAPVAHHKKKKPGVLDYAVLGGAALAIFFILIWFLSAASKLGSLVGPAVCAALSLIADAAFLAALRKKLKAPVAAGVLFGVVVLLFIGFVSGAGALLLLACIGQVAAAASCFLKKS